MPRTWTANRKAALINAIRAGTLSRKKVLADNADLSDEELRRWEQLFDRHGVNGLKTTRVQRYRRGEPC